MFSVIKITNFGHQDVKWTVILILESGISVLVNGLKSAKSQRSQMPNTSVKISTVSTLVPLSAKERATMSLLDGQIPGNSDASEDHGLSVNLKVVNMSHHANHQMSRMLYLKTVEPSAAWHQKQSGKK